MIDALAHLRQAFLLHSFLFLLFPPFILDIGPMNLYLLIGDLVGLKADNGASFLLGTA
jgi:hypothetical protein